MLFLTPLAYSCDFSPPQEQILVYSLHSSLTFLPKNISSIRGSRGHFRVQQNHENRVGVNFQCSRGYEAPQRWAPLPRRSTGRRHRRPRCRRTAPRLDCSPRPCKHRSETKTRRGVCARGEGFQRSTALVAQTWTTAAPKRLGGGKEGRRKLCGAFGVW